MSDDVVTTVPDERFVIEEVPGPACALKQQGDYVETVDSDV